MACGKCGYPRVSDLESLSLAEDEPLTEAEVEILEQQLQHLADKEFEHYATIPRIERENVRAARVHEALNFLVIRSLLDLRGRFAGEGASFLVSPAGSCFAF
ncbi:hypothetical protein V3F56_04335 [Moorellaceae bacterium AZ2]